MVSNDLRAFYSIQERARAAAQTTSLHAANDVLATFLGLRDEARALYVRMGWPEAEFDQEVPPWTEDPAVAALRIGRWGHSGNPGEQQALLARAKHSLCQLAAAIAGNVKAIERDEEFKHLARAKAELEAEKAAAAAVGPVGFARALDGEE
jgi:hypothetical protein